MKELENNSMDDEIVSIESQTEEKTEAAAEDAEISFEDLGLDEQTLAAIEKKGFKVPSPIQALAIPRLLSGESNMIARARTGTGKTAAFGLPIIQKLRNENGTVKALILEPTRELAMQTCTEMQSFTEGKSPRTCVLYGGAVADAGFFSVRFQLQTEKRKFLSAFFSGKKRQHSEGCLLLHQAGNDSSAVWLGAPSVHQCSRCRLWQGCQFPHRQ